MLGLRPEQLGGLDRIDVGLLDRTGRKTGGAAGCSEALGTEGGDHRDDSVTTTMTTARAAAAVAQRQQASSGRAAQPAASRAARAGSGRLYV